MRTCWQEVVNMSGSKFNLQNSTEKHSQGQEKAYSLGDEFLPVSVGQWIAILNIYTAKGTELWEDKQPIYPKAHDLEVHKGTWIIAQLIKVVTIPVFTHQGHANPISTASPSDPIREGNVENTNDTH